MKSLFLLPEFMVVLILGSYLLGVWVFKKTRIPFLHPLVVSVALIIGFLSFFELEYDDFMRGGKFLSFLLGPSVVALGYLLYEHLLHVKGNILSISTAIFVGSVVSILSVVTIAKLIGADETLLISLAPKSVTIPIAINISEHTGGIPSLTVVSVVICGILGGIVGPYILRLIGIESKIAKGLAMGAASHAIGTARAIEMGAVEGAISGLAIGLMGICTAVIIPLLLQIIQ
ncbi:LrgB family protein [Massilibacteroides vaginae]|uniref:LrgB family protein n=1 Tax=Massilibacteroides vaginae TaxID=1673718 RepID=UPI000A1C889F|nr:LrgB family protein [Massilibacteroides vaginae]